VHSSVISQQKKKLKVVLVGNPNTGKTSVFNALTGLRQRVGNYPGVTVEKKTGDFSTHDKKIELLDVPGLYSLLPKSLDDKISSDIVNGFHSESKGIDLVVLVADASNLNRNLYLLTQIIDTGLPVVMALNMLDVASKQGVSIDVSKLQNSLGIPVVSVQANKGGGISELKTAINDALEAPQKTAGHLDPQPQIARYLHHLIQQLGRIDSLSPENCKSLALRLVSSDMAFTYLKDALSDQELAQKVNQSIKEARDAFTAAGHDWHMLETRLRYDWIDALVKSSVSTKLVTQSDYSDTIDKILTHRFLGPVIFVLLFAFIFQAIFTWAQYPMDMIQQLMDNLGGFLTANMQEGMLRSLFVNGVIAGVGSVLVFLPQILFLFFFLGILEDTGYMARVAFMMDRMMRVMGLSGRSVIPLLSSFACAVPGIMATRTIRDWRDRLVTIMIAPFMSCSARLPVYILLIGTFIPKKKILGILSAQSLTLLGLYLFGILMAGFTAWIYKLFFKVKPNAVSFIMELPAYRSPNVKWTLLQMWTRSKVFIKGAGGIILAISIVLWFLASFPQQADGNGTPLSAAQKIENSYAGQFGKTIEPLIKPLGFDWKIGIGLVTSFAAREVMVSTLSTIYNLQDGTNQTLNLRQALRDDRDPLTGKPVYTLLTALSLLVYYVLACQCMATVAIVKRETNSWRWPFIMIFYMSSMAYLFSLIVYQGGLLLGWG